MRSYLAGLLVAVVSGLLFACGGDARPDGSPAGAQAPVPSRAVELRSETASVGITVELADSLSERRRGLSGRERLAADTGMLFVNDQDVTVGYHMRDTSIPLSLAFIAADGEILAIVEMEPCRADPCPVYEPPSAYRFGLEVNRGAFSRWGIEAGARLVLAD